MQKTQQHSFTSHAFRILFIEMYTTEMFSIKSTHELKVLVRKCPFRGFYREEIHRIPHSCPL